MDTKKNRILLAVLAFGFYFIVGAICTLRGAELSVLADLYQVSIDKVVMVGTYFALGRVLTVYIVGKAVQKYNPLLIMFIGVSFIGLYLIGIVAIPSLSVSSILAFFAGIGMGCQDAICPLFLSYSFTKGYASSLSAGQALYGFGGFALSFLVGIMFTLNINPTITNYIVAAVAIMLLVLIPFAKYDHKLVQNNNEQESVKPLYTNNETLAYVMLGLECFVYCMLANAIGTYAGTFGLFKGLNNDTSAYLLTANTIGSFVGSILFIFILRKMKEITALILNSFISTLGVILLLISKSTVVYFIAFTIIGIFSGVLFSIILAIITRIGYTKIAVASSIIGTTGGIGDCLAPIITAFIIKNYTVITIFEFVLILCVVHTLIGIVIKRITREEL